MTKTFIALDPQFTDPKRMKLEREKAAKLKKSSWWYEKKKLGKCEHCGGQFPPDEITMDHVVPIARGGTSTKNNIVASCRPCNQKKHLSTPVEDLLEQISREKESK